MKFVIAPDSFKKSMTAQKAARSIQIGLQRSISNAIYDLIPLADGGEGTVDALVNATRGSFFTAKVTGPLGLPVTAQYGIINHGTTAIIEMAAASGIQFTTNQTRNPLITTTFGTGELIIDALNHGVTHLIIGLGGSVTNDGGAGMAQALGVRLLDNHNQPLSFGGGSLEHLAKIDTSSIDPRIAAADILIACDVTNPLVGKNGASVVFGPQKGASNRVVQQLDQNLSHFADEINIQLHKEIATIPGGGAAGGLGAGLLAFTPAKIKPGIDLILDAVNFASRVQDADFVITGEGSIDSQTRYGKTPFGVASLTKKISPHTTVIALGGRIGTNVDVLYDSIDAIFPIVPAAMPIEQALVSGPSNLIQWAENFGRLVTKID